MADPIYAWCTDCGEKFTKAQILSTMACPKCGSEGMPCSPDDDVEIKINWHELRILTIWAENFAVKCPPHGPITPSQTIKAIAKRLQEQFPSRTPLTLAGELAQLAEKHEITVHGDIQPDDDALPPKIS